MAEIAKIISIILLTMLKFIFGPTLGYAAGYPFLVSVAITITGMMLSVLLFTYLGAYLRKTIIDKLYRNSKVFSKRNRKFVVVWKKYGERGVAFLTPLLLTPIGGTLILTGYKTKKGRIVKLMTLSAIFWAFVFCGIIYFFADIILSLIR